MCRIAYCAVLVVGAWNLALAAENLTRQQWNVEGVAREALVYVPPRAKPTATPVVVKFFKEQAKP